MYEEFPKMPCRCQAVLGIGSKIMAKLEQHYILADWLKFYVSKMNTKTSTWHMFFYLDFVDIIYGMVKFYRLLTLCKERKTL